MRSLSEILVGTKYNENQMEFFMAECCVDFLYFAKHVLGFELADYHRDWYELSGKFKRLSITAFRGSGKTCFFSGLFVWKAIFSQKEFLIVSHKLEQAKYVLKIVKNMFMDNAILKHFVPQSREATWKATELQLTNNSTFYCKPYNENVRSIHPDEVLCDEAGEYEDKSIFWTAVLGTIQIKQGRVTVIGTPKSAVDLLSELKDNDEYFCKDYPAEVDGRALWQQKYTLNPTDMFGKSSLVRIRKEMGELPYTQEYLLIPISSANSLFPYELTSKALDESQGFLPYGKKSEKYFIGYDMAISPKGDYTVMTVFGVNEDRKLLVRAVRIRDSFDEQKRRLRQLIKDFQPVKVAIDSTGIGDIPVKEMKEEFGSIIVPVKITYEEKYKMLMDLRQEFERYNIVIPNDKKDIAAYGFAQQLLKEANDFALKLDLRPGQSTRPQFRSGQNDDCIISLALANKASQNVYGKISVRLL